MEDYKILKDLISFNTIKDKENSSIISYIEDVLVKKGFKTLYKGKYLIMSIGDSPKLGFLGHTDTVEYIEGWDSHPFTLTKKDNKLYGLGVSDMKGGIAAIIDAVKDTDFSNLKYGMKLYFTYDEEIGFGGIYDLVKSKENFPKFMIFGEPTNNEILVGSKGIFEVEIIFNGIKAHSSTPNKGVSANLNAIKFLSELDEFYNKEIKVEEDNNYEIPYTTMNVGLINGGSAKNSVSAKCTVVMDFRSIKDKHIELIKKKLNELSSKYDSKVNIIEEVKPFYNDIEFIKEKKTANFITEASLINDVNRMILGLGPVTAHEINEHVTEESYSLLVSQYKDIINRICKNS